MSCTLKFKVGDRVKYVGGYFSFTGLIGTVKVATEGTSYPYVVVLDKRLSEHDPIGGWIVEEKELEIVAHSNPRKLQGFKKGERVRAYGVGMLDGKHYGDASSIHTGVVDYDYGTYMAVTTTDGCCVVYNPRQLRRLKKKAG